MSISGARVASTIGARLAGSCLTLLMVVLLGRLLGPMGAGIVLLCWTSVQYLGALARTGTHVVLLRVASQAASRRELAAIRGIAVQALGVSLLAAGALAVAAVSLSGWIGPAVSSVEDTGTVVALFALALPFMAVGYLFVELLKALGKVELGSFIQTGMIPLFVLPQLVLTQDLTARRAAGIFLVSSAASTVIAASVAVALLRGVRPLALTKWSAIARSSMLIWLYEAASIGIQWIPVLGVALVLDDADLGIFLTAHRFAGVMNVFVVGLTNVLGPEFARMGMAGDLASIGFVLRRVSSAVLAISIVICPLLAISSPAILGLAGDGFRRGAPVLVILAIGQFLRAATSPSGHVLAMLSYERSLTANALVALIASVSLATTLPSLLGLSGAAIAASAAVTVQGLMNARSVLHATGLSSAPVRSPVLGWRSNR